MHCFQKKTQSIIIYYNILTAFFGLKPLFCPKFKDGCLNIDLSIHDFRYES